MVTLTTIQMYEIISEKIGKQAAESLTNFVEQKVEERLEQKSNILATKLDIADVRVEMNKIKVEIIFWQVGLWITMMLTLFAIYSKK